MLIIIIHNYSLDFFKIYVNLRQIIEYFKFLSCQSKYLLFSLSIKFVMYLLTCMHIIFIDELLLYKTSKFVRVKLNKFNRKNYLLTIK